MRGASSYDGPLPGPEKPLRFTPLLVKLPLPPSLNCAAAISPGSVTTFSGCAAKVPSASCSHTNGS